MSANIVHFELYTKDAARAKRFYSTVFGWKFKDSEIPGVEYYLIDGTTPGGALNPLADRPGAVIYFGTDDIDASIRKIRELGGKAEDKQPIPGQGWFAACTDTEGNAISLFQEDPSIPVPTTPQEARA